MKKSILLLCSSVIALNSFGQSDVSGPLIGHQRQAGRFVGWAPGLGSVAGPLEIRNDFNQPINFFTNNVQRTRLNGTLTTNINGVNQNVDGYFGIGRNNFFATNSPYSMLHLEGNNNSLFLAGQWRRWMNTGVYMRENADAMYVGLKYANTT